MMTKILKFKPWIGAFPLSPFLNKLDELKSAEGNRRILILMKFRVSLFTILNTYTWIGFILKRIDNDLYNDLESHKKFQLVSKGVRVTADEMPPSNPFLTNIDIVSLIVFVNILMDDIARFLRFLFRGESTPKTKNFDKLKKTMRIRVIHLFFPSTVITQASANVFPCALIPSFVFRTQFFGHGFFCQNSLNLASFAFSFGARVVRTALVAAVTIAIALSFAAGVFVGAVTHHSRRISNKARATVIFVGKRQ